MDRPVILQFPIQPSEGYVRPCDLVRAIVKENGWTPLGFRTALRGIGTIQQVVKEMGSFDFQVDEYKAEMLSLAIGVHEASTWLRLQRAYDQNSRVT